MFKKTNLYLDTEVVKKAKKITIDNDTSVSQIVNDFLKDYIEKNKDTKQEKP